MRGQCTCGHKRAVRASGGAIVARPLPTESIRAVSHSTLPIPPLVELLTIRHPRRAIFSAAAGCVALSAATGIGHHPHSNVSTGPHRATNPLQPCTGGCGGTASKWRPDGTVLLGNQAAYTRFDIPDEWKERSTPRASIQPQFLKPSRCRRNRLQRSALSTVTQRRRAQTPWRRQFR